MTTPGRPGAIDRKAKLKGAPPGNGNMGGIPGRGTNGPIRHNPVNLGPVPNGLRPPSQVTTVKHNKVTSPNAPTPSTNEHNKPISSINGPGNSGSGEGNTKMAPRTGSTNTPVGVSPGGPRRNPPVNKAPGGLGGPMRGNPPGSKGGKLPAGTPVPWKLAGVTPPANNKPDIAAAASRFAGKGK